MDNARFVMLIEAYGSEPRRWPEAERSDAERFAARDAAAARMLAGAARLDDLLFAHRVAEPSAALRTAVLARAPDRVPLRRRVRLWWAALGLGIAAAGGALAGSAATAALLPAAEAPALFAHDDAALFGGIADEEGAPDA